MSDAAAPSPAEAPVTFSSILVSFGATCMEHASKDAPSDDDVKMARFSLGALQVLQDKTSGNLDDEEQKLLESMLAELQQRLA
jgi:hypothetical protein